MHFVGIDVALSSNGEDLKELEGAAFEAQVVCDHRKRIRDISVGYPGSVHDSRVFRSSPLFQTLQAKFGGYFIIEDSGLPLFKTLSNPFSR
ncbi:hypothetical protein NQ317_017211 [Molorchus minor]|uniref:DDE Tnp4 domain-containing protein n=1 Tax=Molorchus minor TaxID=1323400 RepID=A0ABQ9JWW2_9CUCU|nr:hypothetical protein NQ317_017211 [Molorchus minor]